MPFNSKLLRKERKAAGFTLESFADALRQNSSVKATKANVWAWERLGVQPGGAYLMEISRVLGKPIEYFLEGK